MLTVQEAAHLIGISPDTVYQATNGGRLPFTEIFGRKIISRADAEAYKERTRAGGEKPKGRPKGSANRKKEAGGGAEAGEQTLTVSEGLPMHFHIRRVRPDDSLSYLTDLLHRAYKPLADMGLHFLATHQDIETTRERLESGVAFVGEVQGRIVATVTLYPPAETSACAYYNVPGVWSMGQFAIEPELQRYGLGSRLLAFVEAAARQQGATHLALDTSEHAAHLIAYYEKQDFRFVEYVQWDVTNYRSVVLSKSLGEGQA